MTGLSSQMRGDLLKHLQEEVSKKRDLKDKNINKKKKKNILKII
jgi:hypothetical protein